MRAIFCFSAVCLTVLCAASTSFAADIKDSVVKVTAMYRAPELTRPWTKGTTTEFSGTGFVIDGERIITNAHVAEYATQIFVQPAGSSDRFRAKVTAIATGIDLAVLELVEDKEKFFAAHPPLELSAELPDIGATVNVHGFPEGGTQISVTEGIVSRIEYSRYYNLAYGLVIQVDAALNSGNSGGPAISGDRVVGVVFSNMPESENIGFIIPVEELNAFLEDVADGTYDGVPVMKDDLQTLENDAIRDKLGMPDELTGMMVTGTFTDDASYPLRAYDILDRIGPYDIENDGYVNSEDGLRLAWSYYVRKVMRDGAVPMTIVRAGKSMDVNVPLAPHGRSFAPYLDNTYPDYFIYGPLVFTPVYGDLYDEVYLEYHAWYASPLAQRAGGAKAFDGEQLIVSPSPLFPHRISKGYETGYFPVLESVNGVKIRNMNHLVETLRDLKDEYVTFEWDCRDQETLVFKRSELEYATEEILEENGIRHQMSDVFREIWDK